MSTIKADNISPVGSTLNLTAPVSAVAGLSVAGGLTVGGIAFFSGGVTLAGGLTVGGIAFFSGGVTFNSTTDHAGVARFASGVTFNSTTNLAGVARFASTSTFTGLVTLTGGATSAAVISCGTAPTEGQHLANKTYVENRYRVGATVVITGTSNTNGTATNVPTNWSVSQSSTTFSITIPTAATNSTTGGGTWYGSLITRGGGGACDMWPISVVGNGSAVTTTVTNTSAQGFTLILIRTA